MIKVLHIVTDTNIGGAGRLLIQYLRNFDRSRFDISVAAPSGSMLIPLITECGYRVIETEKGHDRSWEKGAVSEYKRIIRAEKPDIVHTHSALSARLAAYLCGVKSRIYTRHCAFEPSKKLTTFPGKQLNGLVNNTLSTAIIAVAHSTADNLISTGIDAKKIHVIINGVEPLRALSPGERLSFRSSLGIGADEFVCLISARLEDYKGHSYLIKTAREVRDALGGERKVRLIFMGDGSEREKLEAEAKDAGVGDIIIFTGFVDDVAPYCNIMDLNLNCSWASETSSLALSEGMSLAKPAVVTDVGGNPYMVTDGVNGFVIPKKNPGAMAEAILRLIRDGELLGRLGQNARAQYEEKFTAAAMTHQLEKIYEEEMQKR